MHSNEFEHVIEHFQRFYTSDRIRSDRNRYGSMFKKFASIVIQQSPEFSKEEKFIQEIIRIKGALK